MVIDDNAARRVPQIRDATPRLPVGLSRPGGTGHDTGSLFGERG